MNNYISHKAKIGKDTYIGINSIIKDYVKIGNNCIIGNNVIIYEGTTIGNNIRIDDNTVIGKKPMISPRSIFKEEKNYEPTKIDDNCIIGTNVIIYTQAIIGSHNLIADTAVIRENVTIGDYNIIGHNVTIENFCKIGSRNKFETNSYITAYSEVEDYCFVAPYVVTSNDNYMGRDKERYKHFKGVTLKTGSRLGVNSVVLPGKILHQDAVAGANSLVTKDIPKEELWIGSPAKFYKKVPEEQLLKNNKDKK